MEIKTKFDKGDIVYFKQYNKVFSGKIEDICIECDFGEDIRIQYFIEYKDELGDLDKDTFEEHVLSKDNIFWEEMTNEEICEFMVVTLSIDKNIRNKKGHKYENGKLYKKAE